ncbi:MAG: hypothetical protein IPP16_03195 [Acidimicrobiaceae bacterium]|nr:hypothetical protein [Acidimicrobiaceae bacterium]
MADEMPEEFLRRITQGEAGYYEVATIEATASGRLVVLFDAGPDQLGAARIGHLATILLLWRKAERAGVQLGDRDPCKRPARSRRASSETS